jgi:hypothetical protein
MNTSSDINEDRIARQLCQTLDSGSSQLPPEVAERLYRARNAALARHRSDDHQSQGFEGGVLAAILPRLRYILMVVALALGLLGSYYWHLLDEAQQHGEIDSELLADDLPPTVHTDQGFRAWLERASSDSSPH